jgi:hypothetical protein
MTGCGIRLELEPAVKAAPVIHVAHGHIFEEAVEMGSALPQPYKSRLQLAALVVLLTGLGLSARIYLTAPADSSVTMADEYLQSKKYAHELTAYGGKLTVVADEFFRWFAGLWQGRQLAVTIAAISFTVALGLFLFARSDFLRKNGH